MKTQIIIRFCKQAFQNPKKNIILDFVGCLLTYKQVRFLGKTYLPGSFSKYSLSRNFSCKDLDSAGALALSVSMRKLVLFAFGPGKLVSLRAVQMMGWMTRILPCINTFLQLNEGTEGKKSLRLERYQGNY